MTLRPLRIASLLLCALTVGLLACGGDTPDTPDTPDAADAADAPDAPDAAPPADEPTTGAAPAAPADATAPGFRDTEWTLVALEPAGGNAVTPGSDAVPTLQFESKPSHDGKLMLIGFGGCNRFFGNYSAGDAGSLSLPSPLGSTRMACPEPAMGLETTLMQALSSASSYVLDGSELTITYAGGVLRFSGG